MDSTLPHFTDSAELLPHGSLAGHIPNFSDILIGTWQKSREILDFRDQQKHPANVVDTVPLFERSIPWKFQPYLEILFRGKVYQVVFDIELTLIMKDIILEIENATIKAVHSGSLDGSGSISLWGAELIKRSFPTVRLPGIVKLGKGIRI